MFHKKTKSTNEPTLLSVVRKSVETGFVFWNINDDLGHSSKEIMDSTPLVKMSYGYARRSAAAGLYTQGLFDRASYEHAVAMFKSLQQQTIHTVEFQEAAAADASNFLKSYHYLITDFFERKVIQIANEYDIPKHRISDADLFRNVIETAHAEQVGHPQSEGEDHAVWQYLQSFIEQHGLEAAVTVAAGAVIERIPTEDVAYEFMLAELDGASQGNEYARETARCSGISREEYVGALAHSNRAVDGPEGPQQMLLAMSLQLSDDQDLMARFRCDVGRVVQEQFRLGAYAT